MHFNNYKKWKEGEGSTVCTLDEWLKNGHMLKVAYLIEKGACSKLLTGLKRAQSNLLTWLKRVHTQSCLLDWKGCTLKVAYLIEKGACSKLLTWLKRTHTQSCLLDWKGRTLKVAYLIEKGAHSKLLTWLKRAHPHVKGERARGVGQKTVYEKIFPTVWTRTGESWIYDQTDNSSFSMDRTQCTYMSSTEFKHQRREDERWAGKQCKGWRISFRAMHPQQCWEFSNPRIENRHQCCAPVLGFYREKCARNGGQKVDKWEVLFEGNTVLTVPWVLL
jgi:hypothetical protein